MSYNILATKNFEKELKILAKKYSSLKDDLKNLFYDLAKNPTMGVSLGKNCYKIRFAISSKGKGKSGGARIITYVFNQSNETIIYLLTVYDKSKKEKISDKELKSLLKNLMQ